MKHKELGRYQRLVEGDCIAYTIRCGCGEIIGGWTPKETEEKFGEHTKRG